MGGRLVAGPNSTGSRYENYATIAGPISENLNQVSYRTLIVGWKRVVLACLLLLNLGAPAAFIAWLVVQHTQFVYESAFASVSTSIALGAVVIAEVLRLVQTLGLGVFAFAARDPLPMRPRSGLRIAAVTTIVPDNEPIEMVQNTLRALQAMQHSGYLDVWILDEGDDPTVRSVAAELGVRHFTRKGSAQFNTQVGEFRTRTKAGNHNAWRSMYGSDYDVVAQVDPDHVPGPEFLERTLGYFRDPDVAFVVAPQVYGNCETSFLAHAAAAQGYVFTGIVQRGGNGLGAPLLIGTNHLYRVEAWNQIGGYQDSIIEDHLTSMVIQACVHPRTGNNWRGVYTPDILAVGEGPSTWTDFFRQQARWTSGVWEIIIADHRNTRRGLSRQQQIVYAFLQSFYPVIGLCWFLGNGATILYLTGVASAAEKYKEPWIAWILWGIIVLAWIMLFRWLRQWYLQRDERHEGVWRAWIITVLTAPVYASAGLVTLRRARLDYLVTGKGRLRSRDTLAAFHSHLAQGAVMATVVTSSATMGTAEFSSRIWAIATLGTCAFPPLLMIVGSLRSRGGSVGGYDYRAARSHSRQRHRR
jgi:cellulose synthase (UDP-forming)